MDTREIIKTMSDEGNWFRYSKIVARELGIEAAIVLGNLIDKSNYFNQDKFYHVRDDAEFETGATPHQQRKGEKALKEHNLINVTTGSHPTKLQRVTYYELDFSNIGLFLTDNNKNLRDKKQERNDFIMQCQDEVKSLNPSTTDDEQQSLKSSTTSRQEYQQPVVEIFDSNKTKENKTKCNKNKLNNTVAPGGADEPHSVKPTKITDVNKSTAKANGVELNTNIVDALEYEDEPCSFFEDEPLDEDDYVIASDLSIEQFIYLHASYRELHQLPSMNYDAHRKNLEGSLKHVIDYYTDSDGWLISKFHEFCDDKGFSKVDRNHGWEIRSDRSPTVMVDESVFRRFLCWIELHAID